jgi:FkbM family methyltransferase
MGIMRHLAAKLRRFRIPTLGVIHVGAHEGQEVDSYARAGFRHQIWIEPQPDAFAALAARLPDSGRSGPVRAFNLAIGDQPGTATMHRLGNNRGMSNSLLPPKLHLTEHPDLPLAGTIDVPVDRLDNLLARERLDPANFSLLVADVQGYELHVLRGAPNLLTRLDAVLLEVFTKEHYAGCPTPADLDNHLRPLGFARVMTKVGKHGYGDALYVRAARLSPLQRWRLRVLGPARR